VHRLVEEVKKELFKLMMVDNASASASGNVGGNANRQAPTIDWELIEDNSTKRRVRWLCLDNERTKFAVDGQWWLYESIFNEQKLRKQFIDEGLAPKFKKDMAEAYQQHID
jgi:hypothetical protein